MPERIRNLFSYAFLILLSIISVFPIYWMIVSATNTSADVLSGRLIPGLATIKNLGKILALYDLKGALWNSFRNSSCLTVLALIICSMAGFGSEIYRDKHKDAVIAFVLLGMMIPTITTVIPLFKLFSSLKMLSTMWAVIVPTISTPFTIFLFRQNTRNFPRELIQAARIDGMSELQIFLRVYMPVMAPVYVTAMTILFMNTWNAFLWPNIVLTRSETFTMPVLLSGLISGYEIDYGAISLTVTLCTLPTILIFLALQKSFAIGVTGAVKG